MVFGSRGCGNLPVSLDLLIMSALTEARRPAGVNSDGQVRGRREGGGERDAGVTEVLPSPGGREPAPDGCWHNGTAQTLDTIN